MQFLRIVSTPGGYTPQLVRSVEAAEPQVVQLDYRWPACWPVDLLPQRYGPDDFARGVLAAVKGLLKHFYLDESLTLVTDAGGWGTVACAEAVAELLCEGGCPEVLLSVVRGEDLLARAEELAGEGVDFGATRTGTLSAKALVGPGPIAKALGEGARVVIAGRYAPAAPLQAASLVQHGWSWEQRDALAGAAVASHLPGSWSAGEVLADGTLLLGTQTTHSGYLRSGTPWADFDLDLDGLTATSDEQSRVVLGGARAGGVHETWPVCVESEAGYETTPVAVGCSGIGLSALREQLGDGLPEGAVSCLPLEEGAGPCRAVAVVCCRCDTEADCEQFAARVAAMGAENGGDGYHILGPWPVVHRRSAVQHVPVPREAITISIDTRPASEWR